MVRNKFSIVVYVIIGLAVIGIISQLFTNPIVFMNNIFMMIGFGLVVFAVIYFVFLRKRKSSNSGDMKKYKQAVKQSQLKYKQKNVNQTAKPRKQMQQNQIRKRTSKSKSHLRVIDGGGDKPKRKNRANF